MRGKFMKVKKYILPVLTCIMMVSSMIGCSSVTKSELYTMIESGSEIEITLAEPDKQPSVKLNAQTEKEEGLAWVQLDQLTTYRESFRPNFDKHFNITVVTDGGVNGKSGCIYINENGERDGNRTFMDSLRNREFMTKYFADSGITMGIAGLANKIYADVESTGTEGVYAAFNAYYNLFPEVKQQRVYFNAHQTLSRADFYGFVYRASNKVQKLEDNAEFEALVKDSSQNTKFASQTQGFAWLNMENTGLRAGNYKSDITRVEAVYLMMNYFFENDLREYDASAVKLSDAKDGGKMLDDLQYEDKETKEIFTVKGSELGVLHNMLKGTKGEVQSDLYKALALAKELGVIDTETEWNEALTKYDAIDLMVKTGQALNKKHGYATSGENGTMVGNTITNPDGTVETGVENLVNHESQEKSATQVAVQQEMEKGRKQMEKEGWDKEVIDLIIQIATEDGKTFAETRKMVIEEWGLGTQTEPSQKPAEKVVEEEKPTPKKETKATGGNGTGANISTKPTQPKKQQPKPQEQGSGQAGMDFTSDNRTDAQKKADEEAARSMGNPEFFGGSDLEESPGISLNGSGN